MSMVMVARAMATRHVPTVVVAPREGEEIWRVRPDRATLDLAGVIAWARA